MYILCYTVNLSVQITLIIKCEHDVIILHLCSLYLWDKLFTRMYLVILTNRYILYFKKIDGKCFVPLLEKQLAIKIICFLGSQTS